MSYIFIKYQHSLHQLCDVSQGHSQSKDVQSQLKHYLLPEVEMAPILGSGAYKAEVEMMLPDGTKVVRKTIHDVSYDPTHAMLMKQRFEQECLR